MAVGKQDEGENTELVDLMVKSVTQLPDKNIEDSDRILATNNHVKYDFKIEGRRYLPHSFNTKKLFELNFSFHDGPGGAMFTDKEVVWREQELTRNAMLEDSKNAHTLVFLFDGNLRQSKLMHESLSRILPLLQRQSSHGKIGALRILILLNKADVVSERLYVEMNRSNPYQDDPYLTPDVIAQQMDPLGQAIECLGLQSLKRIRNAMRADAELAIGLTSTWGFKSDGRPLVNNAGKPNFQTVHDRGADDDFLAQWNPFGIRDALIYLATGKVSPTIHIVRPYDLVSPDVSSFSLKM